MTLLDDRTETDGDRALPGPRPWIPCAAGAAAAASSLAVVLAVVLLAWSGDASSPGDRGQALGFGAAAWLLLGGARLTIGGIQVSFLPLVLTLVPLVPAVLSVSWLLRRRDPEEDGWVADLLPRGVLKALGGWWAAHSVIVLAAALWAQAGPARPVIWSLTMPLVVLPVVAIGIALAHAARADEWLVGPRLDGSMLPIWLSRSLRPALRGALLVVAVGAVLVIATIALSWREVQAVQAAVGGGGLGATLLWLVQGAALPNLSIWGVSFLAGPGFSVVDGAGVSWTGAHSGLLPLVPVLAALPQPQSFPWFVVLAVLVPVVCGAVIARWALAGIARLSGLWTKTQLAVSTATVTALVIGALDLVGGSSLGAYRLSGIGAPAGWLVLVLTIELAVGAVLMVLWDAWRLRR